MLAPKRRKYRKEFRGTMKGVSTRASTISFGEFGLKALERGWLEAKQIEAARRAITHSLKRGGKLWIRVFPHKPVTARPAGQRMGGGKGDIAMYVAVVTPGRILFEISGVERSLAEKAFKLASAKLPFKTKVISKGE